MASLAALTLVPSTAFAPSYRCFYRLPFAQAYIELEKADERVKFYTVRWLDNVAAALLAMGADVTSA